MAAAGASIAVAAEPADRNNESLTHPRLRY
jgi:hypothetical protein